MKFLYILKPARAYAEKEMRYSLRSIDKYHPGADVYIVGGSYDWITNVTLLRYPDKYRNGIQNVTAKIKHATEKLPDGTYVYMNDDFILLKPWIHSMWYDRRICDLAKQAGNEWRRATMEMFCNMYPTDWLSYENHRPFSFDMAEARTHYAHIEKGDQHAFKTLMGNTTELFPKFKSETDAKVNNANADFTNYFDILECISISPSTWGKKLTTELERHFPNKSRYEV